MKKVLSFVLILALVLGSFSFAFGLTDVTDASANSEAIKVANDLGIVEGFPDGSFKPDQDVTRAEFAAMMTRALAVPESALVGFSSTSFKDTSGYGWAVKYLAFCESKGIMIGDGYGNVMPGRTINVNEAMTMVLRSVGYTENSALLVGTWPSKYVTLAQDLDMYDDVASTVMVDRANAAQIIYNALTVQKVQVDVDGKTTGMIDKDSNAVTMLTAGLKATQDNKGKAYVLGSVDASTAVVNAQKYVGAFVKTYSNSDGDIIALEEVSTFLTGKYIAKDNVFKADGVEYNIASPNAIKYTWTDNAGNVQTGVSPVAIFNGQTSGASVSMDDNSTTYAIAVDLSGKTIKEVYSIGVWISAETFEFEDGLLEDDNLNSYDFTLDDNDNIDYTKFNLVGVKNLNDIAVDDVVTVYLEKAFDSTSKIAKVGVSNKKIEGTITKVSGNDYTLDGKVYEAHAGVSISLGEKGVASLDYKGDIAFWDLDGASTGNYAMFMSTDKAISFGTDTVKVKLFDKTGAEITPTVKDEITHEAITLDGLGITSANLKSSVTKGSIVEFSLNSAGKVDELASAKDAVTLTGTTSKDGSLIGTTPVYDGVIVFLLDSDGDFEIGKISDFDTDKKFENVSHTAVRDGGKIKAIAVVKDQIVDEGDYSYGVINATGKAIDADLDKYMSLEGYIDGVEFDKLTEESTAAAGWTTTTNSGLARFTVDADGVITEYTSGTGIDSDDFVSNAAYSTTSKVALFSGNRIKFDGGVEFIAAPNAVVYLWNATDEEWELSRTSALRGKYVKMYTTDSDKVTGFDIILAWE